MSLHRLFRLFVRFRFVASIAAIPLIIGPGLTGAHSTAAAARTNVVAAAPAGAAAPAPEPGVCKGCVPPLQYNNGPVMGATSPVTITPIYWAPNGFSFPAGYVDFVNRYISDIAAASGAADNTYAILTEYYQSLNGAQTNVKYQLAAGVPIMDTTPYPAPRPSCSIKAPYKTCTNKTQIEAELASVLAANNLPADLNHLYVLLFPPGTQTKFGKDRSNSAFCGIHQAADTPNGPIIYADEPYITTGCFSGQSPNNNVGADTQVDTLSHEIAEAITDPGAAGSTTWIDSTGNEIGDICSYNYGPSLGSTDPNNPDSTQYNQVINGNQYYTQTMFSNASYSANVGQGKGCLRFAYSPGSLRPRALPGADTTDMPVSATVDATETRLAADGLSTSSVTIQVLDGNDEPVSGDHVHFDVKTADDTYVTDDTDGACGTLSPSDGRTNANGEVTVTYTASKDNVACLILGIDAESGSSDGAVIYQGTAQNLEPSITDASVPDSLIPGGQADTFTVTATNPTSSDIRDARFDVFLTGDNNGPGGLGVTASQVHLSYADITTGGAFVAIPLLGETIRDGEIAAYVEPDKANDIPAGGTITITFKISLDASAPTSAVAGSPLRIETDLDQFDPADTSQYNLDYVGPANVSVGSQSSATATPTVTLTATPTATATPTKTVPPPPPAPGTKKCPKHAIVKKGKCACKKGYTAKHGKCVKKKP